MKQTIFLIGILVIGILLIISLTDGKLAEVPSDNTVDTTETTPEEQAMETETTIIEDDDVVVEVEKTTTGDSDTTDTIDESGTTTQITVSQAVDATAIVDESVPLYEWNQEAYDKAVADGGLVMLYFYANWCPLCKKEFKNETIPAMAQFSSDDVVAFRVHYRDNETTDGHTEMARVHNVVSQHTKVFIKDGEQIFKTPATWSQAEYVAGINERK